MSPWQRLLDEPQQRAHLVQLYDAGGLSLARNVGRYLWEGLKRGDGILVIATHSHWDLFRRQLDLLRAGGDASSPPNELHFLDAREILSAITHKGEPDWNRFELVIRDALRRIRPGQNFAGIRAYGEMVALLWEARQFAPAIRLEQFWNRLLAQSPISLYCSYAIDVFGREFHPDALQALLRAHTHLVPSESGGQLETALRRAIAEVLGSEFDNLQPFIRGEQRHGWAVMPDAETAMLWLRKNLPRRAGEIFDRARLNYRNLMQAPLH